jgi:hypothetical protein
MSLTSYKTYANTAARLRALSFYITKYSHLWGQKPSPRLAGWVDEYNHLRSEMSWEQWQQYCASMGYDTGHDGYSCLA